MEIAEAAAVAKQHQAAQDAAREAARKAKEEEAARKAQGKLAARSHQAKEAQFEAIVGRVQGRVAHWSAKQLTLLGRVYVAKQVLASMLY